MLFFFKTYKYYFSIFIVLTIYYISTFIISITLLTNAVTKNDHIKLSSFINIYHLKNNFKKDFKRFTPNIVNSISNDFSLKSNNIEFTGKLSSNFLQKISNKISDNISNDFSNPEILLFFYFNSKKISQYINKSFLNLGNYNFQNFIKEDKEEIKKNKTKKKINQIINKDNNLNIKNILNKITKRIASTDYFFLSSPIHFKIKVVHQDIPFEVFLKFNGYKWKIQKIIIPYKKLIYKEEISIVN